MAKVYVVCVNVCDCRDNDSVYANESDAIERCIELIYDQMDEVEREELAECGETVNAENYDTYEDYAWIEDFTLR